MKSTFTAAAVAFVASLALVSAAPAVEPRAAQVQVQTCKPTYTGNLVIRHKDGKDQTPVVIKNKKLFAAAGSTKLPVVFSDCTESFLGYSNAPSGAMGGSISYGHVALANSNTCIATDARLSDDSTEVTNFITKPCGTAEDSSRLFDQFQITYTGNDARIEFVNGRKADNKKYFRYFIKKETGAITGSPRGSNGSTFALTNIKYIGNQ